MNCIDVCLSSQPLCRMLPYLALLSKPTITTWDAICVTSSCSSWISWCNSLFCCSLASFQMFDTIMYRFYRYRAAAVDLLPSLVRILPLVVAGATS